jgi:hypothetical protein
MSTPRDANHVERYVFVVGIPRSGTHLVRQILNASPLARIGAESRFVGRANRLGPLVVRWRDVAFGADDVRHDERVAEVVARIWEAGRSGRRYVQFWERLTRRTDEAAFRQALLAIPDRDARHVLEAAMRIVARRRPVAGEKTPHHVFALDRLFAWYPQAVAIHVIRDPRAVYASARAQGWTGPTRLGLSGSGPSAPILDFWFGLEMALRWRQAMRCHRRYVARYPDRYLAIPFGSLLLDPEREVRRICAFVGLPFSPSMLRPRVAASSFIPDGTMGFRLEALERWRRELDAPLAAWIALAAGISADDRGPSPLTT